MVQQLFQQVDHMTLLAYARAELRMMKPVPDFVRQNQHNSYKTAQIPTLTQEAFVLPKQAFEA